ncbi:MAG: hypothetical protein K9H25_21775 [Rhodospirillum sp.]|nr:hypothetical protein [Rhodospirillum sp.]MCF8502671.1 hypothetical protein [Rhodospirillum sp.]
MDVIEGREDPDKSPAIGWITHAPGANSNKNQGPKLGFDPWFLKLVRPKRFELLAF